MSEIYEEVSKQFGEEAGAFALAGSLIAKSATDDAAMISNLYEHQLAENAELRRENAELRDIARAAFQVADGLSYLMGLGGMER